MVYEAATDKDADGKLVSSPNHTGTFSSPIETCGGMTRWSSNGFFAGLIRGTLRCWMWLRHCGGKIEFKGKIWVFASVKKNQHRDLDLSGESDGVFKFGIFSLKNGVLTCPSEEKFWRFIT